jgi:hypothetical protein
LNVPPPSISDLLAPTPANQQQGPAFEPFDIEMPPPPPPEDRLSLPPAEPLVVVPHASSQAEMTNVRHAEESSNVGSTSGAPVLVPNIPPAVYRIPEIPPPPEDVVMTDVDEEDARDNDGAHIQEGSTPVESEGGEEKMELMGPKTPSSSRAHVFALSNSPSV